MSARMKAIRTISGNQPAIRRLSEKVGQTFVQGVPVMIDTTVGGIVEWDGTTLTAIAGVGLEAASNLTTTGVAKTLTFGSVPNQTSAVNIPRGAPLNDGRVGFEVANSDTVFFGEASADLAVTDVGKSYGLTKDATGGQWHIDKAKTTTSGAAGASEAVIQIVKLDDWDTKGCQFLFLRTAQQMPA